MKVISAALDKLCTAAKLLCAALLAIMLVVSLIEIVRRYIFGLSFPWAEELIRYCIVGVASLGGSTAYRTPGGLVSFDLVQTHLRNKLRLVLELVINTVVLGFSIFMLKNSIGVLTSASILRQISIGLGISMFWPYLPITLGMGILLLLSLAKYPQIISDYKNGAYAQPNSAAAEEGGECA